MFFGGSSSRRLGSFSWNSVLPLDNQILSLGGLFDGSPSGQMESVSWNLVLDSRILLLGCLFGARGAVFCPVRPLGGCFLWLVVSLVLPRFLIYLLGSAGVGCSLPATMVPLLAGPGRDLSVPLRVVCVYVS